MTDPLITEYLPILRGHIINKYRWMENRGNCLLTIDDLVQIASIRLVTLADEWDGVLAGMGKTREGNGGMFWKFLEHQVKHDVLRYYERVAKGKRPADASADDISENPGHYPPDVRTSLARLQHPSIIHHDIAVFFDTLPRKDKVYVALRYFDELSFPQMADVLGANPKTTRNLTLNIVNRWRDHARNQFTDHAVVVGRRIEVDWHPSETLLTYIQNRHRVELSEYLGWVSLCLRADVSYLTEILSKEGKWFAGTYESALSPEQQEHADRLILEGVSKKEIAQRLEVPYSVILGHSKRGVAATI